MDDVADWIGDHDWITKLPLRKIIRTIAQGQGSAPRQGGRGMSNDVNDIIEASQDNENEEQDDQNNSGDYDEKINYDEDDSRDYDEKENVDESEAEDQWHEPGTVEDEGEGEDQNAADTKDDKDAIRSVPVLNSGAAARNATRSAPSSTGARPPLSAAGSAAVGAAKQQGVQKPGQTPSAVVQKPAAVRKPPPARAAGGQKPTQPRPARAPMSKSAPIPSEKKETQSPNPSLSKKSGSSIVSRRPDAIVLIVLAVLYLTLAILCFVAYGTGGKYWYDKKPTTLTTVLAVLGVGFSLLNKITTTRMTTAYRREVGADLLGKTGLTLQNLMQFDQFVNRSNMSLLGSKGFRSITMPAGLCIIVASAILKKSWSLVLLPAPPVNTTMTMGDFAISSAGLLLKTSDTSRSGKNVPGGISRSDQTSTLSNVTASLQFGLFWSNDLFVAQYNTFNYTNDGSGDGHYTVNDTDIPITDTTFGTVALPFPVYNATADYSSIYLPDSFIIAANQVPNPAGGIYNTVQDNDTYQYSDPVLIDKNSNTSSHLAVYLYDNTFALGYYETTGADVAPSVVVESAFQLYTAKAQTFIRSSGSSDFGVQGGVVTSQFNDSMSLQIIIDEDTLVRAITSAGDLIESIVNSYNLTSLSKANDADKQNFFAEINGLAATLALAYETNYQDSRVQSMLQIYKHTDGIVVQYKNTLIFGSDGYTLGLGLLLTAIATSVGIWAAKSVRKPVGVEFNIMTAMSMVANAIDPSTDLSRAINEVQGIVGSKRQRPLQPSPSRPGATRTPSAVGSAAAGGPRRPAASTAARPANAATRPPIRPMSSATTTARPYIGAAYRRRTSAATMRLGLDFSSKLMRLMDDDGNAADDDDADYEDKKGDYEDIA
jgi:hypothetical protein